MHQRYTKTVTVKGVTYTLLGRWERLATVGGRHFSALGSHSRGYTLLEYDSDLLANGPTHAIGQSPTRIEGTSELSEVILRLVRDNVKLPPGPLQPAASDQLVSPAADVSLKACSTTA